MAESLTTFSDPRTEMSILETNQYLLSQLAKTKQSFRDLTEKFLTSKATAYSLANQLQKYKSEEHKALIESVLEEGARFEGELAEKRSPAARLGKHDTLIQAHARELTHLRQKIQEGKGVCYLFIQHTKSIVKSFEGLLRSADIPYYQGQRFCEQLAQGSQLAESLASKLITENHNDKKDEDRQEPLAPRLSRGLQEEEVNEALEASLDEQYLTHSSRHDSHQLPRSSSFLLDMQEASSAVEVTRYTSDFYRENLDSLAQLYNENRDIRKESLSLLAHLNRISRAPFCGQLESAAAGRKCPGFGSRVSQNDVADYSSALLHTAIFLER
ncbi:neuroblastoma breakpoint family member 6-like protein isoform X7 [Panthera leo]|uniref:neuroblastoma breakpoint family member 6-like protein isoform X7 n=1 Tax=Panthera leo TaxID=9689 RepID=UPI001C6A6603|nr:neuroblastoma breakpoint family member 6-like protein isoform X7 [Panthera leo]